MANLASLPTLAQSVAAFRAEFERHLSAKSNRNVSRTIEEADERPVAEWGDFVDGAIAVLQSDMADRWIDGVVRIGDSRITRVSSSPEGVLVGSRGDMAPNAGDGSLWMKLSGTATTTGWDVIAGTGAAAGGWVEEYVGDFGSVGSDVDLATGTNPQITINGVTWTSNAGDPAANELQAAVSSFDAIVGAGLRCENSAVANYNATVHNAPYVATTWQQLLGRSPRSGRQYCVQVYVSEHSIPGSQGFVGPGIHWRADGVGTGTNPIDSMEINGSFLDAKSLICGVGRSNAGNACAVTREGSSAYRTLHGSRLPVGYNCPQLILENGRTATGGIGVHDGTDFPDVEDAEKIATWGSNVNGFVTTEYLDANERIAIMFRCPGVAQSATVRAVRVLSK